jgi:hypothetical protein
MQEALLAARRARTASCQAATRAMAVGWEKDMDARWLPQASTFLAPGYTFT